MHVNPTTGLVPVRILVAVSSQGYMEGEIRGVAPDLAKVMIERKHAAALTLEEIEGKPAKAQTKKAE